MKVEKLSAIAELVSSIAIVVTLAYLAIQTQQNTLAIQATVRQSMLEEDRELLFKQIDYPFLAPTTYDQSELTPDQQSQRQSWITAFFRARESHWLQYQAGVIDETTWSSYRFPLGIVLASDLSRSQWQASVDRGEFAQGFIDDVHTFLSDSLDQPATE